MFHTNDILATEYLAINSDNQTIVGSIGCEPSDADRMLSTLYTKYKILTNEDFSKLDSEYLNAYDINKNGLKLNLQKAKSIKKDALRREREEIFKKLDVEFMLAIEKGDSNLGKSISQKKQKLRDITSKVDSARTFEEIKSIGIL